MYTLPIIRQELVSLEAYHLHAQERSAIQFLTYGKNTYHIICIYYKLLMGNLDYISGALIYTFLPFSFWLEKIDNRSLN